MEQWHEVHIAFLGIILVEDGGLYLVHDVNDWRL
jgi:hypothetical protein